MIVKTVVGLLVVLRTIWVFNSFDMIYLITGGGPGGATETVPIYAYNVGWGLKQLGSQLCDVSDVKTAGKPPPALGRNHSVLAMLGREKAKHPLPASSAGGRLSAGSQQSIGF